MFVSTPHPYITPGKDPVPVSQETGWAPGPVWTGGKSGEVRVASRGQEIVSVASQGDRFMFIRCVSRLESNCISCVPDCQPKHDDLRPAVSKELYQLHRKIWVYKMSNNWKVLTEFYFTLYTIISKHGELLNDIDNTVVISCYCLMFKPY